MCQLVHYSIDHLHIPKAQEFQIYVIQAIKISLDITTLILLLILGHTFTQIFCSMSKLIC